MKAPQENILPLHSGYFAVGQVGRTGGVTPVNSDHFFPIQKSCLQA